MGSRVPAAQLLLPGSTDMWNLAGERFPRMSDSLGNASAPLPTTDTSQCGIAGANEWFRDSRLLLDHYISFLGIERAKF